MTLATGPATRQFTASSVHSGAASHSNAMRCCVHCLSSFIAISGLLTSTVGYLYRLYTTAHGPAKAPPRTGNRLELYRAAFVMQITVRQAITLLPETALGGVRVN